MPTTSPQETQKPHLMKAQDMSRGKKAIQSADGSAAGQKLVAALAVDGHILTYSHTGDV